MADTKLRGLILKWNAANACGKYLIWDENLEIYDFADKNNERLFFKALSEYQHEAEKLLPKELLVENWDEIDFFAIHDYTYIYYTLISAKRILERAASPKIGFRAKQSLYQKYGELTDELRSIKTHMRRWGFRSM